MASSVSGPGGGVSGSSSVIDALSELSESASDGLSSVLNTSNVTLAFETCIYNILSLSTLAVLLRIFFFPSFFILHSPLTLL